MLRKRNPFEKPGITLEKLRKGKFKHDAVSVGGVVLHRGSRGYRGKAGEILAVCNKISREVVFPAALGVTVDKGHIIITHKYDSEGEIWRPVEGELKKYSFDEIKGVVYYEATITHGNSTFSKIGKD
ncbi:MAG: hypothetical protein ABH854_02570 [Candidatus Diapherotrites archaeon]|nr:hypothetical protein [Candidatus Micrarchaeota archaeon]MBU1939249.1 hypothetical protein [Candidatus Micrarchaeota archaeon]